MGAFEGDHRAEPSKQWRAAAQQNPDHVHADLIDQAERECLLHDGRAVRTNLSPAALLPARADDAVCDEGLHGWVPRGRLVVGDHEAWVSPTGRCRPNHHRPHSCQIPCDPSRWPRRQRASPAGWPGLHRSPRRTSSRAASLHRRRMGSRGCHSGRSRTRRARWKCRRSRVSGVLPLCVAPLADRNSSHLHRRRPAALLIGQPPDQGSAVGPAPASKTNDQRDDRQLPRVVMSAAGLYLT